MAFGIKAPNFPQPIVEDTVAPDHKGADTEQDHHLIFPTNKTNPTPPFPNRGSF